MTGRAQRSHAAAFASAAFVVLVSLGCAEPSFAARPEGETAAVVPATPPSPAPTARPVRPQAVTPAPARAGDAAAAQAQRLKQINAVRSWGYQLASLDVATAAASPYDLLIVDATSGLNVSRHFQPGEVERLKKKSDGARRLVVSYLSVGEAEDYRPDYFTPEYMTEDAPDWLGRENPQWKGNRVIAFCHKGWQATILGDDDGRNVYNSIEPSPLYRLIELGFDGVYLDRVDVYGEVAKECPDGAAKMVEFIVRLAAHARKRKPDFLVILQNAEELVQHKRMMDTIDAIAKEDLYWGSDHGQGANSADTVNGALRHLRAVKATGRPVLVIDYLLAAETKAEFLRRSRAEGFVPYIGPRDLGRLWLPGRDF